MDSTGKNRWSSKLRQHQAEARPLYNKHKNTDAVIEDLKHHLGLIITDWMAIFKNSWIREAPRDPASAAKEACVELDGMISAERTRVVSDFKKMMGVESAHVLGCIEKLDESIAVNRDKALEAIDDARAGRAAECKKERQDIRQRWINALVPLCAGAIIAVWSAWLSNRSNERKAINEKRVAVLESVGRTQPLFFSVLRAIEFIRCSKLSDEEKFASERDLELNQRQLGSIGSQAEVAVIAYFDSASAREFKNLGKFYSDSIDLEMPKKKCEKNIPKKYSKEAGNRLAATINAMSPLIGEVADFTSDDEGALSRSSWSK